MLKLMKEFKPFLISIIIILTLLFAQAMADLALPDYMSNIVNVGIQQNGIKDAVPEVIRQGEMTKIKLFIEESQKLVLDKNYRLIDKESLSLDEYQGYLKKYPLLEEE